MAFWNKISQVMGNTQKHFNTKNAAKQGNAGERPDAAARYTVKISGDNSLLFKLHRYLPVDKPQGFGDGVPNKL